MAPAGPQVENHRIADDLERVGELLEAQGGEPYRARAYLNAAATVRHLERPVVEILTQEGRAGLEALPHVGKSIAAALAERIDSGRLRLRERLEGELCPERLLASVPGLGPRLAHRIHASLGIDTLEQLELAAHDGRLEEVPGLGPRRARALREVLGSMLRRRGRPHPHQREAAGTPRPDVGPLLALDARYREAAAHGALPRIAPRRFNPEGEAWLPILHEETDGTHFTVLFSNTARAHRLGHTRDWVVIFFERDGHEDQHTVVTEHQGPLRGKRVVRGREAECMDHYGVGQAAVGA